MTRGPRCINCAASLGPSRIVVGGQWICSDCLYVLAYGPAERVQQLQQVNGAPQVERLFAIEPYNDARSRTPRADRLLTASEDGTDA